jgi:hypothetical protein
MRGAHGRLYRQARRGDVAVTDTSRLATILAAMRTCLEVSEVESSDCRNGSCGCPGDHQLSRAA